ncbi:protein kinase domain-containing protein [Psychroserpens jangbogonensis]|uniref:protein kinase domain-containing protein n=1 Tax=Psychroserpens jangbogonensis TaxID=1484460 RepID=UPI00053D2980|nr:hypothetical protein [Psychroserpens jangbogonensis]
MSELHTMIVWSNASQAKESIEKQLSNSFKLLSVIEIEWDKEYFNDNLKIFYAHSQKHLDVANFDILLKNKVKHCGDEIFTLFVYEDFSPIYDFRITSSGNRKVNTKVFDLKDSLRKSIGGGHKIHASDNLFESNKDLTLLLGLNIQDYLKKYSSDGMRNQLHNQNCLGVNGYKNIDELFYVLNNSINYCVLRNYECLPEEYTVDGHGDIDLLVEDFNYMKYLTLAKSCFPDKEYRVHYGIEIANTIVPFDFRFVGDQYYDIKWQRDILNETIYFNSIIKVPDLKNYFYSLLYHAYIQKKGVKDDYIERLENMSKELNVDYRSNYAFDEIKTVLNSFMNTKTYSYTVPIDKTVYFNQLFLKYESNRLSKFGKLIASRQARFENDIFFTEVYDNGKFITKYGSDLIIKNEFYFLDLLKETEFVPKINNHVLELNNCYVVIEKLKGKTLDLATQDRRFWNKKNIISLMKQLVYFNEVLLKNEIMHRDIKPENLMVYFDKQHAIHLKLFDFGWAVKLSESKKAINPLGLGEQFKYKEGQYSDLFSTGKMLANIFNRFQFKDAIFNEFNIKPSAYKEPQSLKQKIKPIKDVRIDEIIQFNVKDYLMLFIFRNPSIHNFVLLIKKCLKSLIN